jgi:thymidylate synthase
MNKNHLHPDGRPYSKDEFIERIKNDDVFAKKWGELGPIYGKQWRSWDVEYGFDNRGFIDQIANLINDLKTNPDSRRLMVNAWNVGELDQMTLPPCHYGFQVYTRELKILERTNIAIENKLIHETAHLTKDFDYRKWFDENNVPTRAISLMWNQRSVDTFLGLPFNIASYGLLLEIIAKEVNMVPDELIGNLGDVHLYSNHIEQAKEQMYREPMKLPTINFNTEWWDKPFFEAINNESFCKCLIEEDIQLGNYKSHPAIKAPLSN